MSRAPLLPVGAGALIGFAFFAVTIGLEQVVPSRVGWLLNGTDWTVHYLGWYTYRHEPWTFPVGATRTFLYPVGTSVGLTDSIPLLAIPLKALGVAGHGEDFQFIGFWLMVCFVLQGVFGVLLLRTRTAVRPLQILGAALFVLAPPLLYRVAHPALTAHWLLLACLWVYFSPVDQTSERAALWWLLAFSACSAALHPYLALMVLALVSAFYIRVLVSRPARWLRGVVVPMVCILAVVALTFWQSGYLLVSGGDMQSGGLGHYSMNLLAPVMAMGTSRWFRATALERVATAGQYEGYAYLGAGLLVVTCIALAVGIVRITRRGVNVEWRSVVPLLLVCLVLTLLALSPTITAGTVTVLQYRESLWGPLSVFRSSGRLFWPVFYCALFIAVAIVARGLRPWIAASLLVAAIILQIADLAAYYQRVARSRQAEWLTPLQNTFWKSATPHYRHVTLVPTALCANPADAVDYRPFALLASDVGITINSGFAARLDLPRMREYCRAFARDRARGVIAHDELYIVSPAALPEFVRRATTPIVCPMLDGYAVCFSRESYVQWQDTYDLTLSLVPRMPDLLWFRDALEAKYRDDLQRSPSPAQGSMADRVAWIAKFVSYRYTSCTSDDAFNKVLRELGGTREARLCPDFRPGRGEMPAAAETVRLLEAVERFFQSNRQTQVGMTSVDPEGEAAWMTAYISARLDGRRREEARDQIFGKIDAVRR